MTSMQTITNPEAVNFEVTKTIGLIADTHIPKRAISIPQRVFEIFQNVDFIIHAGDLVELTVIDELEQIAPVLAVQGNMDSQIVCSALPKLNSLKIFDWKIGVMHNPDILSGSGKMLEIAKQEGYNVFVYGYTHSPRVKWEGEILCINPGSPTDPASFLNKPSVGLLKLTRKTITPQIINL
jgi:putative phosphoesterase